MEIKWLRNESTSKSYDGREISYQGEYYENRDAGYKKNGKKKFFIIGVELHWYY